MLDRFVEISAKSNFNVRLLFSDLSRYLWVRFGERMMAEEAEKNERTRSIIPGGSERSQSLLSHTLQQV